MFGSSALIYTSEQLTAGTAEEFTYPYNHPHRYPHNPCPHPTPTTPPTPHTLLIVCGVRKNNYDCSDRLGPCRVPHLNMSAGPCGEVLCLSPWRSAVPGPLRRSSASAPLWRNSASEPQRRSTTCSDPRVEDQKCTSFLCKFH